MRERTQANQILLFTSGEYDDKAIIGMVKTTKSFDLITQQQVYKHTVYVEKENDLRSRYQFDWEAPHVIHGFMEFLIDQGLATEVIAPLQVQFTDDGDDLIDIDEI